MLKFLMPVKFLVAIIFLVLPVAQAADDLPVDGQGCGVGGMPFDLEGKFYPKCEPDILYSWMSKDALYKTVASQHDGIGIIASSPEKVRYFAITPLSSHAYGEFSVRVKLKPGVKFVFANLEHKASPEEIERDGIGGPDRDCSHYLKKYPRDFDRLVIVSFLTKYEDMVEILLCSDGPVQSWSYGTREHLLEMQKEYRRYKEGNYDTGFTNQMLTSDFDLQKCLKSEDEITCNLQQMKACPDGKACSPQDLRRRISNHGRLVKSKAGEIFYSPRVNPNRINHFLTNKTPRFFLIHPSEVECHRQGNHPT